MELCGGGDLDKHMQRQKGPYSEHQAAILMEQILKSAAELHGRAACLSTCAQRESPVIGHGNWSFFPC
ncbi:Calcium-dependent protein kinase 16 [Durusdinium trenchii]|uniref:Calcium-dependent protein kinase 16 n=1 Tax=Durusdinium trenchii TaxID=1381693 RepID=A0ABP0HJD2_9DINO